MKTSLIIILIFLAYCSSAQINSNLIPAYYQYTYDNAGNRTQRTYTPAQVNNSGGTGRAANPQDSSVAIKYGINVYPNPTSQNINVTISSLTDGQAATIYLFDEQGRNLLTKKRTNELVVIEITNLSSGIYELKVVINSEQVSYRIVKL